MLPDSSAHSVFADEMPKDLINSNVLDNLSPEPEGEDKPQEACGVFGVLAAEGDVAKLIYFGLYALQHRGQESAGITVYDDRGTTNTHKAMGLVSQVFNETVLSQLKGALAIGHNRYSTTGSSKVCNAQPIVINTRLGDFSLAHNGNLVNATELRAELSAQGHALESTTDS
ncbi:MAG: class II glutamine amidotransferase, partial [Pseudanabaena sp.]